MSKELLKEEYLDLSNNMRSYGNMRFAQLTIFIGVTAALLNALFSKGVCCSNAVTLSIKIGGIISVIVFYILEERAADFYHHFHRRAEELEKELGYAQYKSRAKRKIFSATNAVRLLFISILVFWILSLCPKFIAV